MKSRYRLVAALLIVAPATAQSPLPGTAPLTGSIDLAERMIDDINNFLVKETATAARDRARLWKHDFSSAQAYEKSIEPNRKNLARIIGAVDPRVQPPALIPEATLTTPSLVGRGKGYQVHAVRWPVFEGVFAEGLLLNPDRAPGCRVVAIPDADWTPESLAGLTPGVDPGSQFARRLVENGCQVLVPVLIDRKDTWSGVPRFRMTNQPHREWIYRMAYQVGRHIIGYEVQKVLAAVDWFAAENQRQGVTIPIGVAGYAEGGLLALHAAALDNRIQATLVSGYFQTREELWKEPVYRDVWGLVREFGDAEVASLIAPRALVIEASRVPDVTGPPPSTKERSGATPNGALTTPAIEAVRGEVERARPYFAGLKSEAKLQLTGAADGRGLPGSDAALTAFLSNLGAPKAKLAPSANAAVKPGRVIDPAARLHRLFDQLVAHTQRLVTESPTRRAEFWKQADSSSPARWKETTQFYRNYIWDEVIGRLPAPNVEAKPRTRQIYDTPRFRGYEVVLDVWPGVYASGILLVPKDLKPGERRPVVVCQHGLEGRPRDVADPNLDVPAYHRYAARLADEGFITYSPQNPYIFEDRFRLIQRKGHPLKLAIFSFVLGQHQRSLEWLSGLPFVDSARIAFYGLSYGGKTAMRIPPLLDQYVLSICSADFNEWVWKTTSVESGYSYMFTREYDMLEFDFANVVNYSDLGNLMAPRPFMVERGHMDGVAPDEWVAYEFAKIRRFYATKMNLPDSAEIEFFNGPHTINGKGTFEFLKRNLHWPN